MECLSCEWQVLGTEQKLMKTQCLKEPSGKWGRETGRQSTAKQATGGV